MKMKKFIFILFVLFLSDVVFGLNTNTITNVSLIQQCRDYYNFNDYDQTIILAHTILKNPIWKKEKAIGEEALYLINESGEEIRTKLQNKINTTNEKSVEEEIRTYKKEKKIFFKIKKDGFYYRIVYYHKALQKLIKLNKDSDFIEKIKLKSLLRLSRYNVDPIYKFDEDLRILNLYNSYIKHYPGSKYLPHLLLRTADLNFYLYEEGQNIKNRIGYSDKELKQFYVTSKKLYKKILKEYPNSGASSMIGIIRVDRVKLRHNFDTKSKVIKRLKRGLLVKILSRSKKRMSIGNMYNYWYNVQIPDGSQGWVYGFYVDTGYFK